MSGYGLPRHRGRPASSAPPPTPPRPTPPHRAGCPHWPGTTSTPTPHRRHRPPNPLSGRTSTRSPWNAPSPRSEEHTSELQSRQYLVCRLLLEKKKKKQTDDHALSA